MGMERHARVCVNMAKNRGYRAADRVVAEKAVVVGGGLHGDGAGRAGANRLCAVSNRRASPTSTCTSATTTMDGIIITHPHIQSPSPRTTGSASTAGL